MSVHARALGSNDKTGVVEYDSEVNELIPLSETTELFQQQAAQVINCLHDGSCTNLSGGLSKGMAQQKEDKYINWDDMAQPELAGGGTDSASWVLVDGNDNASSVSSASSLSSLVHHLDCANIVVAAYRGTSAGASKPLLRAFVVGNATAKPEKGSKGSISRRRGASDGNQKAPGIQHRRQDLHVRLRL